FLRSIHALSPLSKCRNGFEDRPAGIVPGRRTLGLSVVKPTNKDQEGIKPSYLGPGRVQSPPHHIWKTNAWAADRISNRKFSSPYKRKKRRVMPRSRKITTNPSARLPEKNNTNTPAQSNRARTASDIGLALVR